MHFADITNDASNLDKTISPIALAVDLPLQLVLPVWVGHSCPTLLTLGLTLHLLSVPIYCDGRCQAKR
jgi:hypothetical protein